MKEFTIDQKQFTAWLNDGRREHLNKFIQFHAEQTGEILTTTSEVLDAMLTTLTSKIYPYVNDSSKLIDLQENYERLKEENINLIQENKEVKSNLELKLKDVFEENEDLKKDLDHLTGISVEIILKGSDLTDGQSYLLQDYLKNEKTLEKFNELNKNGKFDAIFAKIKNEDSINKKMQKLLLNTFILSAVGKKLPAIYTRQTIFQTLNENSNKNAETK